MTLKAIEFIRRFLLHVLPAGFVRIRHYGFLANRVCREKLELCRALLADASRPTRRGRAVSELGGGGRRRTGRGPRLPRLRRGPDGHRRDLAGGSRSTGRPGRREPTAERAGIDTS